MRVLLDESIPHRLRELFEGGVEVVTVSYRGWRGTRNDELLARARSEFDAFITTDRGIPHQQNLRDFEMGIVVLEAPSNRLEDLAQLMTQVNAALRTLKRGQIVRIGA